MVRKWTEGELREELAKIVIIVDSREQSNKHITDYFDKNNIKYEVRKLDCGDYSARVGDMTLEHDMFIERKNSLTELCGNMGQNRERFEREFTKAKSEGAKPFLIIENDSLNDVFLGNYNSKLKPKSLWSSLCVWMVRYNTSVMFCRRENMGCVIANLCIYYARERLLYG